MTYKIITTRRIAGHHEGVVVAMEAITEFWEHQLLAGNAVVIQQPAPAAVATEAPRDEEPPKLKGKARRGKNASVDGDPED